MPKLKILFVDATVGISIADSATGYMNALRRAGHSVYHFNTRSRIAFAHNGIKGGIDPELADNWELCSRVASEGIVVEALRSNPDLVIVSSGFGLHPDGLELLNRAGQFPSAIILTESPYEDDNQARFAQHVGHIFTNELVSAEQYGWTYLASAYDPQVHQTYGFNPAEACDVLFVGTGWKERQDLLEGVDWTGINLKILGAFPEMTDDSPLKPYYVEEMVTNDETARLYGSAKIAINHHRGHPNARSMNPRGYELAACGIFQVSDERWEVNQVLDGWVPEYHDSASLENLLRIYLADSETRNKMRYQQRQAVLAGSNTFDHRVATMLDAITR